MPGEKSCKNAKKAKYLKNTGATPRPTLFIIYIYIDIEKISLLRSDFHFLMVASSGAGTMRDRLSSLSCVDPAWFTRPTTPKQKSYDPRKLTSHSQKIHGFHIFYSPLENGCFEAPWATWVYRLWGGSPMDWPAPKRDCNMIAKGVHF